MRKIPVLLAILALLPLRVAAQPASGDGKRYRGDAWAMGTGTVLVAGGTLATFQPQLKSYAVSLRDAVQADGHQRLYFDDGLQYLPGVVPVALRLCGLEGRHRPGKMLLLEGASFLLGTVVQKGLKELVPVLRPDGMNDESFPSSHTFTAFTGAEVLRREYGSDYPWLAVAGYAVAVAVGFMRVYSNRHWIGDVMAGAGIGLLSVGTVYWLLDN